MSTETPERANAEAMADRLAKLPLLMRPADIMAETGLSKTAVYALINSGEIKSVRPTPRTCAVPCEWFIEWAEALKAAALSSLPDTNGEGE